MLVYGYTGLHVKCLPIASCVTGHRPRRDMELGEIAAVNLTGEAISSLGPLPRPSAVAVWRERWQGRRSPKRQTQSSLGPIQGSSFVLILGSLARLLTQLTVSPYQTFLWFQHNFPFFLSHNNTANFAKLSRKFLGVHSASLLRYASHDTSQIHFSDTDTLRNTHTLPTHHTSYESAL